MDNEKIAHFISELRKEKKLTQKELAEQLGVTDKAVSKWERGLSCPDISLLSKLSTVLGITTTELLNGEKAESSSPEINAIVDATLQYADTTTKSIIVSIAGSFVPPVIAWCGPRAVGSMWATPDRVL